MKMKMLDVVALKEDIPALKLKAGDAAVVLEFHANGEIEVEFIDSEGGSIGLLQLDPSKVRRATAEESTRHQPPRPEEPFMTRLDPLEKPAVRRAG
jgi:hypothetical protein